MSDAKLAALLGLIRRHAPGLDFDSARILPAAGQFNIVVQLDESWIFRFPKSAYVARDLAHELAVLPPLHARLPLPIPAPRFSALDADGLPLFMAYAMLPGEPLLPDRFAKLRKDPSLERRIAADLAGFLRALHKIVPTELGLADVEADARAAWARYFAAIQERLFPFMRPAARRELSQDFQAALDQADRWHYRSCLIHGDFGAGNILVADGRVTGIIDFSFCMPGDPAQDLGALLASYGEDFVALALAEYPALGAHLWRARFYRRQYALLQALYALRDGDQAEFDDGIAAYR